MQPTSLTDRGLAPRAAGLRGLLGRVGFAVALALATASTLVPGAAGQPTATDQQSTVTESTDTNPQAAGAGNGGVASTSSGGNVTIEQIVTGENTGNTIITGDIAGSAEFHGGEIAYPTEVNVSLNVGPQIIDASGGDGAEATTSSDDLAGDDGGDDDDNDKGDTDIKIINRNDNRSEAVVKR